MHGREEERRNGGELPAFVCVACRARLDAVTSGYSCRSCGRSFPMAGPIADFSQGFSVDTFESPHELSPAQLAGLEAEVEGTRARAVDFYAPMLRRTGVRRVLDAGTGNGLAVDLLNGLGFDAWGLDLSLLRRWQWTTRENPQRLLMASAIATPFPDGWFDCVISSGVIEHIGVAESRIEGRYAVAPSATQRMERVAFFAELFRITRPGGQLLIDCPNGAFPIDFWHGDAPGQARWHPTSEAFLPKPSELASIIREADPRARVTFLSPYRRVKMSQVGQHWYGRLLRVPATVFLATMRFPPLRLLARSPLNPFLVVAVTRP